MAQYQNTWFNERLLTSETEGTARLKTSINEQLIDGNKALTMQPFTELNIKNGSQFYARTAWPLLDSVAAGASVNVYFETGPNAILVKDRFFTYIAEELMLEIFANPASVTGGTDIDISNWNSVTPDATTIVAAKKDVTATGGTLIQDPEYFFGANASGQRDQTGIPEGYERVVAASTGYLIKITNTGSGAARCQYGLSWYEGPLSVNIPLEI